MSCIAYSKKIKGGARMQPSAPKPKYLINCIDIKEYNPISVMLN